MSGRTVLAAVLAVLLLGATVAVTGGGLHSAAPATPTPVVITAAPSVDGTVAVRAQHLGGTLWRFVYTVRDTGNTPIAGFQLNGKRANLWDLRSHPSWTTFGSGVCGGKYGGMLVYWSVGPGHTAIIPPAGAGQFAFRVRTTGTAVVGYSLSFDGNTPRFGVVAGPAPSTIPAGGPCLASRG